MVSVRKIALIHKHAFQCYSSNDKFVCEFSWSSFKIMPSFCLIVGCGNKNDKCQNLAFCRVPKVLKNQGEQMERLSLERRTLWLAAISRGDLTGNILENDRVCGNHFISGRAAQLWDRFNPDWIPSLHLGHEKKEIKPAKSEANLERSVRMKERRKREAEREEQEKEKVKAIKLQEASEPDDADIFDQNDDIDDRIDDVTGGMGELTMRRDVATNTDESAFLGTQQGESKKVHVYDEEYFCNADDKVKFYTGLPSYDILMKTFSFIAPHTTRQSSRAHLSKFQEFIMVLMKLRLNVPHQDLAYRFDVSRFVVSRIFHAWIEVMDIRLSPLIVWPERKDLQKTMPTCFMDAFGMKTTVIIDCFEVFIDRPTNLLARAQTFSNYKHHNTVKVLIGITPQGTISFVSEAWGGRTSDKFVTENSGFLKNLLPGDLVLADRGFTVQESVSYYQASLNIPAFTSRCRKDKKYCKRTDPRRKGYWSFETKIYYFTKYTAFRLPYNMQQKRKKGNPFD